VTSRPPEPAAQPTPDGARPRVLVVDDDRAVRDSLRRSLEFNGYEVATATDGAEEDLHRDLRASRARLGASFECTCQP
jgi:ActR/RegA family two-component response regulator